MSSDIDVIKLEAQPFIKRSVTTAAGNVGGTTLVDITLTEANDYWLGSWLLIRTGTWAGQLRQVTGFVNATNTLTLDHGIGGQILKDVQYVMSARGKVELLSDNAVVGAAHPLPVTDPALSVGQGTTTGPGAGGLTVVDVARTEVDDYWNGMALLITSGAWSGQVREITDWDLGTGTFTVSPAYGGNIVAGVSYKILASLPGTAEVAAIEAKLDARLDVAVSSRAAPGAAMALTAAERLVVQALIINDLTPFPGADVALIKTQTDKIPNVQHETEWATTPAIQNVASAGAVDLTAGSVTPTFPTGSTRVRALLVASIKVLSKAANTHHITLKVQGQKAAGGYTDLLDLTAQKTLGLVNLDGAGDAWCVAIDVTAKVDTSAVAYDFRFEVHSDNAGSVDYTTSFTLVLVYHE